VKRKLKNEELDRLQIDEFKIAEKNPFVIVLDNVRSLNNIGSIFRTSDAFLVEKIFLCGITATPPNKEIYKTALGATESVEWEYFSDTLSAIDHLNKGGYVVAALEQTEKSVMLNDFIPEKKKKYALVFGHEIKGVGQEVIDASDLTIEIPQFGTKHSFNIVVSVGIVLWDILNKIK
jgi:23S rRNA (guanosine2251-2'-O)-methyltransferase